MTTEWLNQPEDINKHFGFVYEIKCLINSKTYIGKKQFWSKRTRPPLKGRKNKRHYVVESDWKTYFGSSNKLLADIEKYGEESFQRTMLIYCDSKFDLSYDELWVQIVNEVLDDPLSYNEILSVRLRKRK